MSEFEDRLRLELRSDPVLPDEAFAARVGGAIAKSERRRAVGLVLASLAMVGLGGAMAVGLSSLAPAWTTLAGQLPRLFPGPILGLMSIVGVLALGLVFIALLVAPIARLGR